MKRSHLLLLAIFATATAHAGGFGGPPPFTNGSPLQSGMTGTYQASARGEGISGIIRFSYNSKGNPSAAGANDYIFFVNGTVVSGNTEAAIMADQLTGVLDAPTTAPTVPPVIEDFECLGGTFQGQFDQKSPFCYFKGKGSLATYTQDTAADPWNYLLQTFKISGMRTSLNAAD